MTSGVVCVSAFEGKTCRDMLPAEKWCAGCAHTTSTVVPLCTGVTASWCPRCGDCTCTFVSDHGPAFDRADCPLHGSVSKHADTVTRADCRARVDALTEEFDVEVSGADREQLAWFAHFLFEKSRKQKDPEA